MARAFEVKASNVTVHDGTKGIKPDGTDGTGRDWPMGSIVELSDSSEIDGLLKVGAIEPVGEKVAEAKPKLEAAATPTPTPPFTEQDMAEPQAKAKSQAPSKR